MTPNKSTQNILNLMKDMDKTYDPKKIEEDMERDYEENHEYYEKLKSVEKPEFIIQKENKIENTKKGIHYTKDFENFIVSDKLVLIKPVINDIGKNSTIQFVKNVIEETPLGYIFNINKENKIFKKGDKIVFDIRKNNYKSNPNRLYRDGDTFMFIKIEDIWAKIENE